MFPRYYIGSCSLNCDYCNIIVHGLLYYISMHESCAAAELLKIISWFLLENCQISYYLYYTYIHDTIFR